MTHGYPPASKGDNVVVIGAGLMGLSTAFFLHRKGISVTVLERSTVGSGAARGNGGQIVPAEAAPLASPGMVQHGLRALFSPTSAFYVKPAHFPRMTPFLTRFALQTARSRFWRSVAKLDILNRQTLPLFDLMREHGIGADIRHTPYVYSFTDRAGALAGHESATEFARVRHQPDPGPLLQGDDLREYEPALSDAVTAGFLQAGQRWGDPGRFVDELEAYLRVAGVEFVEYADITSITENTNSVAIRGTDGRWEGSHAVIAAGAWSKQLLRGLGARVILDPGKGYSMLVDVETAPKGVTMFADAHVGALPMGEHTVRLAGTMEFDGRYEGLDRRRLQKIVDEAKPYLRAADWSTVRDEWVAPRPMTPDGLPYIGRLGGRRRTYVNAGHNMLGFSLAPASGDLMARLITGAPDPAAEMAFAPDRFG